MDCVGGCSRLESNLRNNGCLRAGLRARAGDLQLGSVRISALALSALLLRSCPDNPAGNRSGELDYDGLASALRAQGARVEPGENIEQPFFSVRGRFLRVNGEDVQAFQYASAEAAVADAARVSPDGGTIGTAKPFWAAPPHFYRRDRLIVLYVGENAAVQSLVERVMGPPFAGR